MLCYLQIVSLMRSVGKQFAFIIICRIISFIIRQHSRVQIRIKTSANMTRYYTLLTTRQKKTALNLVLKEYYCREINNLFSEKLCNTAGHFDSSVFIFSRLKYSAVLYNFTLSNLYLLYRVLLRNCAFLYVRVDEAKHITSSAKGR